MSRHAAGWTLRRRLKDRRVGRITQGQHHPGRDKDTPEDCLLCEEALLQLECLQPTPYGGMEDRVGFAALAKRAAA